MLHDVLSLRPNWRMHEASAARETDTSAMLIAIIRDSGAPGGQALARDARSRYAAATGPVYIRESAPSTAEA